MHIGDLIKIKQGHPHEYKIGPIIDRVFMVLPPGNNKILVYKVLVDSIILNVPLRWMEQISTSTKTQEKSK